MMPRLRSISLTEGQMRLFRRCINLKSGRLKSRLPAGCGVTTYLWCRLVQIFKPDKKVPVNFYTHLYEQCDRDARDTLRSVERLISRIIEDNQLPGEREPEHVPLVTNFYHD